MALSTPQGDSFEMTSQPSHSIASPVSQTPVPQSAGGYVAFNPSARSATPVGDGAQLQSGPRRNITVAGTPGTGDSYFGDVKQAPPQRSATAPLQVPQADTSRVSVTDILDGYGEETPAERPTPPSNPVQQRSHTAGPGYGEQAPIERPTPLSNPVQQRSHTAGPGYGEQAPVARPAPPSNPVQQRSHTAGPAPGSQSDWRQFS